MVEPYTQTTSGSGLSTLQLAETVLTVSEIRRNYPQNKTLQLAETETVRRFGVNIP